VRVCLLRESISLTIQSIRVVHEGEVVYWVHVFIILILGHVVPPIMHLVVSTFLPSLDTRPAGGVRLRESNVN
jgi:hypothetical protein